MISIDEVGVITKNFVFAGSAIFVTKALLRKQR